MAMAAEILPPLMAEAPADARGMEQGEPDRRRVRPIPPLLRVAEDRDALGAAAGSQVGPALCRDLPQPPPHVGAGRSRQRVERPRVDEITQRMLEQPALQVQVSQTAAVAVPRPAGGELPDFLNYGYMDEIISTTQRCLNLSRGHH